MQNVIRVYTNRKGDDYFLDMPRIEAIVNRKAFWEVQITCQTKSKLQQREIFNKTAGYIMDRITKLLDRGHVSVANAKLRDWKKKSAGNNAGFISRVNRTKMTYELLERSQQKFAADMLVLVIGVAVIACPVSGAITIGAGLVSGAVTGYAEYKIAGNTASDSALMAGLSMVPFGTEVYPFAKTTLITLRTGTNVEVMISKAGIDASAAGFGEYINSSSIKSAITQAAAAGFGATGVSGAQGRTLNSAMQSSKSATAAALLDINTIAAATSLRAEKIINGSLGVTNTLAVSAYNICNSSIKTRPATGVKSGNGRSSSPQEETFIWRR